MRLPEYSPYMAISNGIPITRVFGRRGSGDLNWAAIWHLRPVELDTCFQFDQDLISKINGQDQILGKASTGEMFGEIGILCNMTQTFGVRTTKVSQILRLNRTTFINILRANPDSFTRCFKSNPPEPWNWNIYLFPLWCLGVVVRYGFLFPVRFGPVVPQVCSDCGKKYNMGRPVWSAPIHDQEWVTSILADVNSAQENYPAYDKISAVLTTISEELPDISLFLSLHNLDVLCSVMVSLHLYRDLLVCWFLFINSDATV